MNKLTDFKPIKRLELPELGELRCSGLIVIVGPNSSGKSQLLHDIKGKISGEIRELVVATDLKIETPDLQSFLECLKSEGYIHSTWDDNDQEQYVPKTTSLGTGQPALNVGSQQLQQWEGRSKQPKIRNRRNEYFGWSSGFLVTALFLENRLTCLTTVATINFETQPPNNDLHALHLNDEAREALTEEARQAFSKSIWSDISRGNQLCLRVSEDEQIPDAKDRLSVKKMAEYRTIESEGDGMKSYVATVISLLLGRRPVTIIDEPELCLHPPQAYNIGQFIGKHGTSEETATFVATHSSQVLRGIIQTADSLQIVRLTKYNNGFSAKHVDSKVLSDAMEKPTVRSDTVLNGIFSQAVTIVEADGDRIVYQAAWEKVGKDNNFDIHFTTAGGTGAIADTCQLYKILGIPVAVIADLDVITDMPKLENIINRICDGNENKLALIEEAKSIAEILQKLPPSITPDEAHDQIQELANQEFTWVNGDDRRLRDSLSSLRSQLNGMRKLKDGGIDKLPKDVSASLNSLVNKLQKVGLFLVPIGELEGWLSDCNISASKKRKWAWANESAQYIRANPRRDDDIWGFIEQLGDYLTKQIS